MGVSKIDTIIIENYILTIIRMNREDCIKGLELCEQYFNLCALPVLRAEFGKELQKMTIGLAGDGSECFGFDDEYSRDHDWGPGFCIWLNEEDYSAFGRELQGLYESLPGSFGGFQARRTSEWGGGRVGVLESGRFYQRFLGAAEAPGNTLAWLSIPENALAAACNGKIFYESSGCFSSIRSRLLEYYPEDVRLKKLAARCMTAGREGQYNYTRSLRRSDYYAADQAQMKFLEDVLSIIFLLNKTYLPYYKWAHRAVRVLPVLGNPGYELIADMMVCDSRAEKGRLMERLAREVITVLKDTGLSPSESDFLPDHGPEIQKQIENDEIRRMNVWAG